VFTARTAAIWGTRTRFSAAGRRRASGTGEAPGPARQVGAVVEVGPGARVFRPERPQAGGLVPRVERVERRTRKLVTFVTLVSRLPVSARAASGTWWSEASVDARPVGGSGEAGVSVRVKAHVSDLRFPPTRSLRYV